jgi:gliding motility-associated-like protein
LVVYVPNSFTPNDDGTNDLFIPVVTSYSELDQYEFRIYDRWGEIVFFSKTVGEGWNGIAGRPWPNSGTEQPPGSLPSGIQQRPQDGTYTWTLRARIKGSSDVEDYRGHVSIIR